MSTPGKWHYKFVESGGYDTMTDAFYIYDEDNKVIATLDLCHYGQERFKPAPAAKNAAEYNAFLICGLRVTYLKVQESLARRAKEKGQHA